MHCLHPDLVDHDREQSVVGTDVEPAAGLHNQAAARAADSRIDHREVHRTPAEVSRPREQHERTGEDVEPRHLMRDVDEHGRRAPGEDDALHRRDQG